MNNDLSTLSDKELSKKLDNIKISSEMTNVLLKGRMKKHNKSITKRKVNPGKFIILKKQVNDLTLTDDLLNEYFKTLIDEKNRRIKIKELDTITL